MDMNIITKSDLFQNVPKEDLPVVLQNLQAKEAMYTKGSYIFHTGDTTDCIGMVEKGTVSVIQCNAWGKDNIFTYLHENEMFAETYACSEHEPLMVDVVAQSECQILFLNIGYFLNTESNCICQNIILQNLLQIMAQKNLNLSRKIVHITPRMIKERLLLYLQDLCVKQRSERIKIPFNRQQLADYLCVDRSALSNEMSNLQKKGMLHIDGNTIILHTK